MARPGFVHRLHASDVADVVVTDTPKTCEYCGKPLGDDRRANTRFCTSLCRARKHGGRTLTGGPRTHSGKE